MFFFLQGPIAAEYKPIKNNDDTPDGPKKKDKQALIKGKEEADNTKSSPQISKSGWPPLQNPLPNIFEGEDWSYQTFRLSQESIESTEEINKMKVVEGEKKILEEGKLKDVMIDESDNEKEKGEEKRKRNEKSLEETEDDDVGGDATKEKKRKRLKKLTGDLIGKMAEIIMLQNDSLDG